MQINNASEDDITMGVSQCSILGPLLFIIYMNDIIHSSNSFQFIMVAVDTTLFTTLNYNEHYGIRNERLNNELEKNKYLAQSEQTFTKCKENKSHDISYATKKGSASSPSNS